MNTDQLPPRLQELHDILFGRGDVQIVDIYRALGGPKANEVDSSYAQKWLGSYIRRLNVRLEGRGLRVVPGRLKGTYALTVEK